MKSHPPKRAHCGLFLLLALLTLQAGCANNIQVPLVPTAQKQKPEQQQGTDPKETDPTPNNVPKPDLKITQDMIDKVKQLCDANPGYNDLELLAKVLPEIREGKLDNIDSPDSDDCTPLQAAIFLATQNDSVSQNVDMSIAQALLHYAPKINIAREAPSMASCTIFDLVAEASFLKKYPAFSKDFLQAFKGQLDANLLNRLVGKENNQPVFKFIEETLKEDQNIIDLLNSIQSRHTLEGQNNYPNNYTYPNN
jgi:hypothetical protein